ncbi:GAF and ANTAR domain-containing protein [Planomonospora venezuelensis]|uniref:GAF domain-containing protein n=1 Tax=Planomonospora venezuelensis TaxID=1999 RepID=A0A841DGK9_PLAVE|nr:GAF and ANTAR domain-containing protein [Planomonospora venezuelensis]MBB5967438.1 GAF domain-containing protein [Planomonospora venezuelensis]GIN03945.1 transcriptional regulator [Planomonospora venezuelensis]
MTHIDQEALVASLRGLQMTVPATGIVHQLERAVEVVDTLFGYSGAGLMFAGEDGELRYLVATDDAGRSLEGAQLRVRRGPCVSTYENDAAVTSFDVRTDPRWPELAERLHPGVRAVAGVPVRLGGEPVGTLNVYQSTPYQWDDSDIRAMQAYAAVIEQILTAAMAAEEKSALADQLQYALDYRVVIERAIGYLMGKHDLTAAQAFTGLRKKARDSRRRVADLAAEVLADGAGEPG